MKILNTRAAMGGAIGIALAAVVGMGAGQTTLAAPKDPNPCAARAQNPCAAKASNPCAAKALNPCAARSLNPCAAKQGNPCAAKNPCNPCGGSNPCNPCGAGASIDPSRFVQPEGARLAGGSGLDALGAELWNDRSLGKSGLACASCHVDNYGQMQPSFATPYPHPVAMPAEMAGVRQVNAAEMVQFCMIQPMAAEPFDWSSRELAALTAYVQKIQPGYSPGANPCNPCGMKNPCNPCGR